MSTAVLFTSSVRRRTACALIRIGTTLEAAPLHPDEAELKYALAPRRWGDFTAGRLAAAQALSAIGVSGPVLRKGRRPLFPPGVKGAISHSAGCVGASLVSRCREVVGVGVDVERTDRLSREAEGIVCTPWERAWVAGAGRPQSRLSVLFSVKEAVYKAISALRMDRRPTFHDAEVRFDRTGLRIRLVPGLLPYGFRLTGEVRLVKGSYVVASVLALAPGPGPH
ncbi:4'-phosphopantetheinyl transferase superfamily protein [Streptomyces sp. NPDC018059]|uniref:4'-phosphopantetheinyl transferase superfamily protein n=1 Tax=Streptomyces sp. NPDC018059 TaxID=3365041 RepID=UPI00378A3337